MVNIPIFRLKSSWQGFLKITFITIMMSLLVGCPTNVSKQFDFDETKSSAYYLSQASSTSGDEQINWQLLAIRSLIIENETNQARKLLSQLPQNLNNQQQKEQMLLQGELAVKTKKPYDLQSLSLNNLNDNQKIRYYKIKIGLDGQAKDINAQIRDYIELEKYGTPSQRNQTINDTWGFLKKQNKASISSILVYANEPVLQGWVDLIYTYQNNTNVYSSAPSDDSETIAKKEEAQFNLIKNAITEWQMQYSSHPASLYLPRNIYGDKFRLPEDSHNKSVALLLPLSGSSKVFGDAIYLGYTDANKNNAKEGQQNIYAYDTNSDSIENLIKQAQQHGAELIVGPLLKTDVNTIVKLSPNLPVLALNKVDDNEPSKSQSSQLCFFALAPEDEAKDAAQHIQNQQKTRPLLILPNNDLGKRVANSFAQQWDLTDSALNGVYVQYFDSEKSLSDQMNTGKGIEIEGSRLASRASSKIDADQQDQASGFLNNITSNSTKLPFDAIYIYASHNELTLIKSMLEMPSSQYQTDDQGRAIVDKNGKRIPSKKVMPAIYASSRSNISNTTQDFRYDMDRVQFSDIPLIITQSKTVNELPDYIKNDYSLVRLYALGADAWKLANRFNQLESYQIDILNGQTGTLSVGKQCDITRALLWSQYYNGHEITVN